MELSNFLVEPTKLSCNASVNESSYFKYRVGCDICCRGNAFSFETNIFDITDQNGNFLIDDLAIKPRNYYKNFKLIDYWKCSDKKAILKSKEIYKKLTKLNLTDHSYVYDHKRRDYIKKFCKLHSAFKAPDSDGPHRDIPEFIMVCPICVIWLENIQKEGLKLVQVNPLSIFWYSVIEELFKDDISKAKKVLQQLNKNSGYHGVVLSMICTY